MSMVIPKRSERKYEPYPEYRDSGAEWLGKIPAHWEILSLRRKLQDGQKGIKIGPFGSSLKLDIMQDSGWKVYGQEDIITGDFSLGDRYVDDDKYKELEACSTGPGDILITMMGTMGRCQVVPSTAEIGLMDSHLLRLRVKQAELLPKFIALLIDMAQYIKYQLNQFSKGSIMQGLNSSIIKELLIAVPPRLEQEKILDFLDRETARIDDLIARKQRLIDLLQEQRTALITHTVTKGLDPKVPIKDSGVEWLGKIPAHWEVKMLKYVAKIVTGNTPPKTDPENYDELEGLPWVKPDHLGTFLPITESQECLSAKGVALARIVHKEAVLTCCIGSIGSIGIAGCELATNQQINSVIFTGQRVHHKYGFYVVYASLPEYRKLANLNVVAIINSQSQKTIRIPLPPIPEQQAIADYLDREIGRIDSLVGRINQAIEKLQEYRTALITATVTGEIDVR